MSSLFGFLKNTSQKTINAAKSIEHGVEEIGKDAYSATKAVGSRLAAPIVGGKKKPTKKPTKK